MEVILYYFTALLNFWMGMWYLHGKLRRDLPKREIEDFSLTELQIIMDYCEKKRKMKEYTVDARLRYADLYNEAGIEIDHRLDQIELDD